jgi:hypothetical protein
LLHEFSLDKYHKYRTSTIPEGSSQSNKDGGDKQFGPGMTRKAKEAGSSSIQKKESETTYR